MTAPITNASANESPEMPIARTAVVTGAPTAEPTVLITLLTPLAAAISDGGTIEATNRAQTANPPTPFPPNPTREKNATIATTELGQIASPTARRHEGQRYDSGHPRPESPRESRRQAATEKDEDSGGQERQAGLHNGESASIRGRFRRWRIRGRQR